MARKNMKKALRTARKMANLRAKEEVLALKNLGEPKIPTHFLAKERSGDAVILDFTFHRLKANQNEKISN